jgi:hypothetical protein
LTVRVLNRATGEAFEEYKVSQDGKNVECYIESTVGTEFVLSTQLEAGFRHVSEYFDVRFYVEDGLTDNATLNGLGEIDITIHRVEQPTRVRKQVDDLLAATIRLLSMKEPRRL